MRKIFTAAVSVLFLSGVAFAQTPMTKDGAKETPPNMPTSPDRDSMPKTKANSPNAGTEMPKDESKKKQ